MLNIFFDIIGKEKNKQFTVITGSSCVTITDFDYKNIPESVQKNCLNQITEVEKRLVNFNKIILAGSWWWHLKRDKFKIALNRFLQTNSDKKIYLLADVPHLKSYNPVRMYRLQKLGINLAKEEINTDSILANKEIEKVTKQYDNVNYIDLVTDNVIFSSIPIYDNKIIYHDKHHLNEVGSFVYAQSVKNKLMQLLD